MALDHALVLGGGITGLFTAGVLARHFDEVTLVERDRFPVEPVTRTGVPQGVHVHGLLTRGLEISEELMPGISGELRAHGAVPVDMGVNAIRNHLGWSSRFVSGLEVLGMSRSLFEWTVRRRLDPRITVLDGHRVEGLAGGRNRVTGAIVTAVAEERSAELPADLVVDATGRGSRAPQWLRRFGCAPVPEEVVDAHIGYATRLYALPDQHLEEEDWQVAYVQLSGPQQTRGGLLTPIEGGRWQVTLAGVGSDSPPTDDDAFLPFARTLSSPIIANALAATEPLTAVAGSHATSNRRRYFERAGAQPEGFVAIGDAVCAFNPVYGQGMTVGALSAVLLGDCLAVPDKRFAQRFYARLGKLNDPIWHMTTVADSRFPTTEGRRSGKLIAGLFDRLIHAANHDHRVQDAFLRVFALQQGPGSLLTPSLLARVLRAGRPVVAPGSQPPAVLAPGGTR